MYTYTSWFVNGLASGDVLMLTVNKCKCKYLALIKLVYIG